MATSLEELRVLREAEAVADAVWREVVRWEPFPRQVVGGQLARAADSIGANIAEAFGRFHYGEKLQLLYYARGSLFETKYWLNRVLARDLIAPDQTQGYISRLTDIACQLNAFAKSLKTPRHSASSRTNERRETAVGYVTESVQNISGALFTDADLEWLCTIDNL
jgi:four helix bundle protein